MEDIQARLKESADTCLKKYEDWAAKEGDAEARENLQESIHELRKVASRLEIEIAISERKKMSSKPLPIPPHRSKSKGALGDGESILPDQGATNPAQNNGKSNNSNKKDGGARRQRTRRPASKSN